MESKEENRRLIGNRKELVLCDARVSFTVTPKAQKYALKEMINKSRVATAVITHKGSVRIIVNFAMRFLKLKSAVKMFGNEREALSWLRGFQSTGCENT
jgi:hypothetical protein